MSNNKPRCIKAKQRKDFSSGLIFSKGPTSNVIAKQSLELGPSKKSQPSFLHVYSRRNKSKITSVWDSRVDASSKIQEGEQGINVRCPDQLEGEENFLARSSSEDEEDNSEESDDYSVPETDDKAKSWSDADEILEAIPGLFKRNQVLVLSGTQDQVCFPLENRNQAGEFISKGQQEVSRFYGGSLIRSGVDVLHMRFMFSLFSDIN